MKNIFDSHASQYDSWYEKNSWVYLSEVETAKSLFPNTGKCLEIGVGTGRFASALDIRFGLDPSWEMLKMAYKRGIKSTVGLGENLPFKDRVFDYVAIIIAICFVSRPELVLKEARRVLKPQSSLLVGIVDKESFLGRFYLQKDSIFYKYARFFSVPEIVSLMEKTGFSRFSFSQSVFDYPANVNKLETPQPGFGRGGFVVIKSEKK